MRRIETGLVNKRFGVRKMSKNRMLLKACNISLHEIKINFGRRLEVNNLTNEIETVVIQNEINVLNDKKSTIQKVVMKAIKPEEESENANKRVGETYK
ncbi:hypothetical protein BpHYR1_028779 [Brachionus plicatilis]|uniref:Uncharacterized protein n=1 Tax=Brachionus plicatilis TaxID=10195 RepID=A0A3M7RSA2_BRAPC|nr:hypothetical protein BpHYR1_028779 [Brachionus plicatilis]